MKRFAQLGLSATLDNTNGDYIVIQGNKLLQAIDKRTDSFKKDSILESFLAMIKNKSKFNRYRGKYSIDIDIINPENYKDIKLDSTCFNYDLELASRSKVHLQLKSMNLPSSVEGGILYKLKTFNVKDASLNLRNINRSIMALHRQLDSDIAVVNHTYVEAVKVFGEGIAGARPYPNKKHLRKTIVQDISKILKILNSIRNKMPLYIYPYNLCNNTLELGIKDFKLLRKYLYSDEMTNIPVLGHIKSDDYNFNYNDYIVNAMRLQLLYNKINNIYITAKRLEEFYLQYVKES